MEAVPLHLREAYRLYERFRPAIPEGKKGWGAKGDLDLGLIGRLAKERVEAKPKQKARKRQVTVQPTGSNEGALRPLRWAISTSRK